MTRLWVHLFILAIWGAAFVPLLFSNHLSAARSIEWVARILGEVRAVCRDSGTQWMIFLCSGIYLLMFTWIGRLRATSQSALRPSNPDVWLRALLLFVSFAYALNYSTAVGSFQALLLIFGAAFGKGVALWTSWARRNADKAHARQSMCRRMQFILAILVVLLAGAALWQPEAYGITYQYRGVLRWRGVWHNPNIYGVLMAVGMVLSAGLLVHGLTRIREGSGSSATQSFDVFRRDRVRMTVRSSWLLVPLAAAGLCAYGLIRSYSRGACLAAGIGTLWLVWRQGRFLLAPASPNPLGAPIQWCHSNRIALCVILFSALMISFWQFRHTEQPLARRMFSVGNVNDFSWRNRVTAWQGTLKMMADRPLLGFGWGKAEEAFRKDYRSRRLVETAAVQMNDYLMLGASAGVPALVCFGLYLALGLSRKNSTVGWNSSTHVQAGSSPSDSKGALWRRIWGCAAAQPYRYLVGRSCRSATSASESLAAGQTFRFGPASIAQAGAVVLLVAFWFDGGLFKLPTAVVFWTLFELGRLESHPIRQSAVEKSDASEDTKKRPGTHQRSRTILRWTAAVIGLVAMGLTALHLITPQLKVTEKSVALARKYLVQSGEMADFNSLSTGNSVVTSAERTGFNEIDPMWRGKKLKTLLDHVQLADYNRQLVSWKVDDETYRQFVLSPLIHPKFDGAMNWRRPLWEHFYPRVRRENDLRSAAEIIAKDLVQHVRIRADQVSSTDIKTMWEECEASSAGAEALYVAALRVTGIPARLDEQGKAELYSESKWHPAPRLVFEAPSADRSIAP